MKKSCLKYSGFIYFGLVIISAVLYWSMIMTYPTISNIINYVSTLLLSVIIAFLIGVALYNENKNLILWTFIFSTAIGIIQSISSMMNVLRLYPSMWIENLFIFIFPISLSVLVLIGLILIHKRVGQILVIMAKSVIIIQAIYTGFQFLMNRQINTLGLRLYSGYSSLVTIYVSVLLIGVVIHYFYKPSKSKIIRNESSDITFE